MSPLELTQLELLAEVDELVVRLRQWAEPVTQHSSSTGKAEAGEAWEPLSRCRALVRRLLSRVEKLRVRLEAPLIVATFGGTGTGKSLLVNALVGRECTAVGRERPTTRRPVLVAHPHTELAALGLPLDDFDLVHSDAPLLRDVVIIDCPDPDTTETTAGDMAARPPHSRPEASFVSPGGASDQTAMRPADSNLERLRRLLPHCDVLIYTSTQQKYRSARVKDELGQAATGCRLLFVQTHADLDEDIRDDWRRQLSDDYEVPEVFFVDSLRALSEQQAGNQTTGDFRRLQNVLTTELAASQRVHIRRANLLDLIHATLQHCRTQLDDEWPAVEQLETVLNEQRQKLTAVMSDRLREELLVSRNLWERRLLGAVTQTWGLSPFSSLLRVYNGLGNLIASMTLYRARNSAQMALIGALQGVRWLRSRWKEQEAESQVERISALGLDDGSLREAQIVVDGYVTSARMDPALLGRGSLERLRQAAAKAEDRFLDDAGRRIEDILTELTRRNSRWFVRCWYELLFAAYVGFVLFRVGKNFFYDTFFRAWTGGAATGTEHLFGMDFWISAGVFFVLWSGLLVMAFTRRLRRGLNRRIEQLAQQLAAIRLSEGLFPRLEETCGELNLARNRLETLAARTGELRSRIAASPGLGRQRSEVSDQRSDALMGASSDF